MKVLSKLFERGYRDRSKGKKNPTHTNLKYKKLNAFYSQLNSIKIHFLQHARTQNTHFPHCVSGAYSYLSEIIY